MPLRGAVPDLYAGFCLSCRREHRFENDVAVARAALEALFDDLDRSSGLAEMRAALDTSRGKMIGVLVSKTPSGEVISLRAYSGELAGRRDWPGFVDPVLRRADTAELERETLVRLDTLTRELATCDVDRAHRAFDEAKESARLAAAERRQSWRVERRRSLDPESRLAAETSRNASSEADRARVDAARTALLAERARLHDLRERRRAASVALSTAMFDAATVTNARGERRPLREIFAGRGLAGGTTDCAIPKLLEATNVAGFRPIAIAEAWYGPPLNGRLHGELQAPCERKCQPVLGHLLCGLDA